MLALAQLLAVDAVASVRAWLVAHLSAPAGRAVAFAGYVRALGAILAQTRRLTSVAERSVRARMLAPVQRDSEWCWARLSFFIYCNRRRKKGRHLRGSSVARRTIRLARDVIARFIAMHNDRAFLLAAIAVEAVRTRMRTVHAAEAFAAYALARLQIARRIVIAFALLLAVVAVETGQALCAAANACKHIHNK